MVGDSLMRDQATYVNTVLNSSQLKVSYVAAGWTGNDIVSSCKQRQAQRGSKGQQKWHRYQRVSIGVAAECVSEVYNLTSRDAGELWRALQRNISIRRQCRLIFAVVHVYPSAEAAVHALARNDATALGSHQRRHIS